MPFTCEFPKLLRSHGIEVDERELWE
jgi:hypothetical protein